MSTLELETMSSRERIAVCIDGVNLYATAKALVFDIDYKRLLRHFEQQGQLVHAYYYIVPPQANDCGRL
jgi:uncharacterized LabA/DUF88 family protein